MTAAATNMASRPGAPGSRVVLTVAHLNRMPEERGEDQVAAMCNGCHLHYDRQHHAQTRQRTLTARLEALMDPLFEITRDVG